MSKFSKQTASAATKTTAGAATNIQQRHSWRSAMLRSPSVNCPVWVHLVLDVWNLLLVLADLVIGFHCNSQWVTTLLLIFTGVVLVLHVNEHSLDASLIKNYFRHYHLRGKCYCEYCAPNEDPWYAFVRCKLRMYYILNTLLVCYTVPRFVFALIDLFYTSQTSLDSINLLQLLILSLLVVSRAVLFLFGISWSTLLFHLLCVIVDLLSLILTILVVSSMDKWQNVLSTTGGNICIIIACLTLAVELVSTIVFLYNYAPFYEIVGWWQKLYLVMTLPICYLMHFAIVNLPRLTWYTYVWGLPYLYWNSEHYPFYRKLFQFLYRKDEKSNPNETAIKLYLINQLLSEYLLVSFSRGELCLVNLSARECEERIHKAAKSAFSVLKKKHFSQILATKRQSKCFFLHLITQGYFVLFPFIVWLLIFVVPSNSNMILYDSRLVLFYWLGLIYMLLLVSIALWYTLQMRQYYLLCRRMVQFHDLIDPAQQTSLNYLLSLRQARIIQTRLFDSTYRFKWNALCKVQDHYLYDPVKDLYPHHLHVEGGTKQLQSEDHSCWLWYGQLENRWYSLRRRAQSYACLHNAWQLPSVLSSTVVGYLDREECLR